MEKQRRPQCTSRSRDIKPFYVMELLEKAQMLERKGEDIVHMEIGEPDFATPSSIRQAAIRAIEEGRTFYTHSLGLPELRERIARFYLETRGVPVSPERIVLTNGTSGAFFLLGAALLDRKTHLIISDPGYPCYKNFGTLLDSPTVAIPVSRNSAFEILPEQLEPLQLNNPLLMVCSPANPTGTIYKRESIENLQQCIARKNGLMVVDEIYSGLAYVNDFPCALSISDDVAVVDGFSKTYAMTGWRLGWMVVPPELIRPIQRIAQNVFISPSTVAQYAALAALDATDEVEAMKSAYVERREFLFPRLKEVGFDLPAWPDGAFYIYANIEKWGMDSMTFVERALAEAKVAITPGYDFGSFQAGVHVRFSYATKLERLAEGCKRLEQWIGSF